MQTLSQADITDRMTILTLKYEAGFTEVLAELGKLVDECLVSSDLIEALYSVNRQAWEAVLQVTEHFENRKILPDAELIDWCRKAHVLNKERIALKNQISEKFKQNKERKTWAA